MSLLPVVFQAHATSELHAAASWRCIDILSDLHLSAATPRAVAALQNYLQRTTADAVIVLGDLFEVWVGDDVLDGSSASTATAAESHTENSVLNAFARASQRLTVAMAVGNRDFLLGEDAAHQAQWTALADVTVLHAWGERSVLVHGDAQCLSDQDYLEFRAQVRNPAWQQQFLSQPLSARLSVARQMRDNSEQRKQREGFANYADADPQAVDDLLHRHHAHRLIHGHTHRPADHALPQGRWRHVLSDWDLDSALNANSPSHRGEILRLQPDGISRLVWRPGLSF